MGMSNTDDEGKIAEERELLEWAKNAPNPGSSEREMTEEERIAYKRELEEWRNKRPNTRNPYDTERR